MSVVHPRAFDETARAALADGHRLAALDQATKRLRDGRLTAWDALPELAELRQRGHDARMRVVRDLDANVERFREAVEANGGQTTFARTAAEACDYVVRLCQARGARLAAKSKSMLSEELGLNEALERVGVRAVETDLGEYVMQLAGEHPMHILAPAIDKTREDAAALLSRAEGVTVEPTLPAIAAAARRQLRETFRTADVGITGANFGVVSTGTVVLVTNEGNGRLVSALPRVHVALVGMERLVADLSDLAVLLRLLARSATGQTISSYTTLLTGPRRPGEEDGPDELHVVIVDNERSRLLDGPYEEMLACIRCGSCLNVCPVYRKTGGSSYGPVYSGPMGAVLVPLLAGLERAPDLPHASSLCGACTDACPVKIPLHELLLKLRHDLSRNRIAPWRERTAFALWSVAWSRPFGYRATTAVARRLQRFGGLFGPGRVWSSGRGRPRLVRRFRDRSGGRP